MGKGILVNLIGRSAFIVGAYIIHIYAGRKLAAGLYGTFGVVLSILTISYILLENGVRQFISRTTVIYPGAARSILKKGLLVQISLAIVISSIIAISSRSIATFFQDMNLVVPLQICAIIIVVQSIFFVYMGTLNGQRQFIKESIVQTVYSVVRPLAVVIFVWINMGVSGIMMGFLVASVSATAIGVMLTINIPNDKLDIKIRQVIELSIANILIFGSLALLMNIDLLFVKFFISDTSFTGFYTAASTFSKVPYWLIFSFGSIALPIISSDFKNERFEQCRAILSKTLRYSTMIFLPIVVIIASTSKELIVLVYGPSYSPSYIPLSILVFGLWFAGIMSIYAHVMIAMRKERIMALMSCASIIIDIFLNITLLPMFGIMGAAIATSLSALILLIMSGWYVNSILGLNVGQIGFTKTIIILIFISLAPHILTVPPIFLPLEYAVLYGFYILALVITHEIGMEELILIREIVVKQA